MIIECRPGDTVKIHHQMHNELIKQLRPYRKHNNYPKCFILGKDKNNTIAIMTCINKNGIFEKFYRNGGHGCREMVGIPTKLFIKISLYMFKKGFIPCGIARVGNFGIGIAEGRGGSLRQLYAMNPELYVISMGLGALEVQSFAGTRPITGESIYRWHKYAIVGQTNEQQNRKGVKFMPRASTISIRLAELTKPITVSRVKAGTTLEAFLEKRRIAFSSAVRVNAETASKGTKLRNGDIVTVIGQVSGGF